jgi:O-antigen ligase
MMMSGISLGIAILTNILSRKARFQHVPSVAIPLLFLLGVVLVTAKLTGGIGFHALGGTTIGGKKLFFILASVIGYYAISNYHIPAEKSHKYAGLFVLSGVTAVLPNLIYMGGPTIWFLYMLFPPEFALNQAVEDFDPNFVAVRFSRLTGVTFAAIAAVSFLFMKFGLRDMLDIRKPWKLAVLALAFIASLLGGFRSALITFALLVAMQFWLEGLFRTRFLVAGLIALLLGLVVLIPLAPKLPLSVQRSLSVLPVKIDPMARADAQASTEWRLEMWKVLLPQISEYLWLGKGYAIDPSDLYLAEEAVKRNLIKNYEVALLAGDYHSGPLSVLVPFGIFGVIGFLWFIGASIRLLYRNYRFSDPSLQKINTFLLASFLARFVYYIVGVGALSSDLVFFAGTVAFSIALNGGMRKPAPAPATVSSAALLPAPAPA